MSDSSGRNIRIGRLKPGKTLSDLYPELIKEWDYSRNIDVPENYGPASDEEVHWICKKGHPFPARIANRTKNSTGCPYCSGNKVGFGNDLFSANPPFLEELIKETSIDPTKITKGSNIKLHWLCKRGHAFKASPKERYRGRGCGKCHPGSSRLEIVIFAELKSIFLQAQHRHKLDGYEIDIFIPELAFAIEIDGYQWHKTKLEYDKEKQVFLATKGIKLLRLRDHRLPSLSSQTVPEIRITDYNAYLQIMHSVISYILENYSKADSEKPLKDYLNNKQLTNLELAEKLINMLPGPTDGNSLAKKHPDVALTFMKERNKPLTAFNLSFGSSVPVWWKCSRCSHEWRSPVKERVKHDCNKCQSREAGVKNSLIAAHKNGFLKATHPDLWQEILEVYHKQIRKDDLPKNSYVVCLWKCKECSQTWPAKVASRVGSGKKRGTGCPHCFKGK